MKHKKILACFLTFSFLLTGCSTKDQSQSLSMTGTYFDTVVKIEVWTAALRQGCYDPHYRENSKDHWQKRL